MHRVEKLEALLARAASRGYVVRQEWLGGLGCGVCEMGGRKYLFVDLALSVADQLGQIAEEFDRESICSSHGEPVAALEASPDRKAA